MAMLNKNIEALEGAATKLLGPWAVAYCERDSFVIGRLTRDPNAPPPWPVDIYGTGNTWQEALQMALATHAADQAVGAASDGSPR